MKKILLTLTVITCIVLSMIIVSVNSFNPTNPVFVSSDGAINLFYAKIFSSSNELFYFPMLEKEGDGVKIFRPKYGTVPLLDKILPEKFIGFPVIIGYIIKFFSIQSLKYFNPIVYLLILLTSFFLVKKLFGVKISVISLIFLSLLPSLSYFNRYDFLETSSGVFTFLICYWLLLIFIFKPPSKNYQKVLILFILQLALFFNLFIRPDSIFFWAPIFVVLLFSRKFRFSFISNLPLIITSFIFITPFYYYYGHLNLQLFGNIFKSGSTLPDDNNTIRQITPGFFDFGFKNLLNNISIVLFSTPFIIPSLFVNTKMGNDNSDNLFTLTKRFALSIIIIYALYILSGSQINATNPTDNSSVRYIIVLFIIVLPLFAKFLLNNLKHPQLNFILAYLTLLVLSIYTSISINNYEILKKKYSNSTNEILLNTEENSVVISSTMSKNILNIRQVATFDKFGNNYNLEQLVKIIKKLINNNISTYIYLDDVKLNISEFKVTCRSFSLKVIPISENIYKIINN